MRVLNFSAGPATLPEPVLNNARDSLWDLDGSGIGILEHSHRGAAFLKVLDETIANCRDLASISDDYEVLFLQGGASHQFFMAPMNWLSQDTNADYINTGAWSKKAIQEAKFFGTTTTVASSEDAKFNYIPKPNALKWSKAAAYAHYTSNNTIAGTQFSYVPDSGTTPLLCDASSDIFSQPIDVNRHAMIYAGAQKNLGPSGLALVILRKDMIESGSDKLPTILQYRTHSKANSSFNTPPTFGIYMMGEVFKWIQERGGLTAMGEMNRAKAKVLYDYLDGSSVFTGTARRDSRSLMNITFRAKTPELEAKFIAEATLNGLPGLKGHRSVGGMRASIYNAFPAHGVTTLVEFMKKFETNS